MRRVGSGVRSAGLNPLMLSPRNEGNSRPSTTSVGLERGLKNVNIKAAGESYIGLTLRIVLPFWRFLQQTYSRLSRD